MKSPVSHRSTRAAAFPGSSDRPCGVGTTGAWDAGLGERGKCGNGAGNAQNEDVTLLGCAPAPPHPIHPPGDPAVGCCVGFAP